MCTKTNEIDRSGAFIFSKLFFVKLSWSISYIWYVFFSCIDNYNSSICFNNIIYCAIFSIIQYPVQSVSVFEMKTQYFHIFFQYIFRKMHFRSGHFFNPSKKYDLSKCLKYASVSAMTYSFELILSLKLPSVSDGAVIEFCTDHNYHSKKNKVKQNEEYP